MVYFQKSISHSFVYIIIIINPFIDKILGIVYAAYKLFGKGGKAWLKAGTWGKYSG